MKTTIQPPKLNDMNLSELIYDWVRTRKKLKHRVTIWGMAQPDPVTGECCNVGQIRMKIIDADVYDPEIWVANIEPTRVVFRCDLRPHVTDCDYHLDSEHVIEANDPEFFKKLERHILKFSNI